MNKNQNIFLALADFATQAPRDRALCTRGRAFPDLVAGFRA